MSNEVFSSNDFETFWVPEDSYTIKFLHSVGTAIVSQSGTESEVHLGTTYPMNADGSWDTKSGVQLEDVDLEWFQSLEIGSDDYSLVEKIIGELNNCRLSMYLGGQ